MPNPWKDTVADRVIAGIAGGLLGFLVNIWLMSDSVVVWVALPIVFGTASAAFGWRGFEGVMRLMWWLV
jgi:hypothetical protein